MRTDLEFNCKSSRCKPAGDILSTCLRVYVCPCFMVGTSKDVVGKWVATGSAWQKCAAFETGKQ